jgi:H+/Cl- antiporter ClcA
MKRGHLVKIFNGKFLSKQRTAELNIVKRNMNEWLLLVYIFCISTSLGEIVGFSVVFTDVVELVFVERGSHHDATHLQILMILLVKITLLPSCLLSEQVNVDSPL